MLKELKELDIEEQIILDDLVHDEFTRMASNLNNEGIEEQVRFLLENKLFSNELELLNYIKKEEE